MRWIAEDAESLRRLEAIQRAAHDWAKAGRGEDFLIHRGGRLEEAEALVSEARFALTDPVERDYLDACLARRRREEEEAQAVREREAKAERDRLELEAKAAAEREAAARKIVQRTRIGAGVALCLAAAAGVIGYIAYQNAQRAEAALASAQISDSQRFAAFSKEATRQDQAELGVQMALDALDKADTPEARDALRAAVFQLHDVVTLNQEGVTFADFGPDPGGRYVLAASEDGVAQIWDLVSGKDPVTLWGHGGSIWAAQFSADGARVMTASDDGTARLWDAATGKNLLTRPERAEPILAAQLSGDGSRMVIVSENDGSAHVWDTQSGEEIVTLSVPEGPIGVAAFSPGGERLVTGSEGGTASVWDLATGHEIALLKGHTGPITAVEFAPDGARVVTASFDGTARVWQAQSGERVADLPHNSYVKTAHFSPDGQRVITATWGGIVRLWDAASGEVHEVRGSNDAHFGPRGRLAIGADDGTASVWDAAAANPSRRSTAMEVPSSQHASALTDSAS